MGHKQKLTVVKIDKIEYDVSEEDLVSGIGSTTISLLEKWDLNRAIERPKPYYLTRHEIDSETH